MKTLWEVLVRTIGTSITASEIKELHNNIDPVKIFAWGKACKGCLKN